MVALRSIAPPPALLRPRSKELRRALAGSGDHSAAKRPLDLGIEAADAPAFWELAG
jgi:hypothetical protein